MNKNFLEFDQSEQRLSPKEAAHLLNVSAALIYKMIGNGTLPANRFGVKLLFIKLSDLQLIYRPSGQQLAKKKNDDGGNES